MLGTSDYFEIKGFENYLVNNKGQIYSKYSKKNLKTHLDKKGYLYVTLGNNKNFRKKLKIHRILAEIFLPKIHGKDLVNHKNGIKTDNRIENLEWCNTEENILHSYLNGLTNKKPYNKVLIDGYNKIFPSIASASKELKISYKKIIKLNKYGIFKEINL